jgi:hypothetical protein
MKSRLILTKDILPPLDEPPPKCPPNEDPPEGEPPPGKFPPSDLLSNHLSSPESLFCFNSSETGEGEGLILLSLDRSLILSRLATEFL